MKNDRLLKALTRQPVDRTPIWFMRQAGRYLPEYRATRAKAGRFLTLCQTPELACEVTLQPLKRYDLDAAIIFSDILTIPDAMGLGLEVIENKGPIFHQPLRHENQINSLELPDLAKLNYVYDAIRLVNHELSGRLPLIGFAGSPWTLAAYMVEGQATSGFPLLLKMLEQQPLLLHDLLHKLANAVCAHLNAQIAAGIDVVMLFDTWGGLLTTENYEEFSLFYLQQIIDGLLTYTNKIGKKIPIILFTRGGYAWLEQMAQSGCDCVGLDWGISLEEAKKRVGHQVALQGNMDPAFLLQSPESIRQEVKRVLASFGQGPGHVFNLGHGITPDVPPEHVTVLIEAVQEMSCSQMRQ